MRRREEAAASMVAYSLTAIAFTISTSADSLNGVGGGHSVVNFCEREKIIVITQFKTRDALVCY